MSTVTMFQNRVAQRLSEAGLQFDKIDSYGNMVSAKLRPENVTQPAKLIAFRILDAIRGSRIYDYFEVRDIEDGRNYLVIRFTPGNLNRPHRSPKPVRPPEPAALLKPKPAPKPVPVKPTPVQVGPVTRNSYADLGSRPTIESIAWILISKKHSDQLKQARCRVLEINDSQVKVEVTKTGQQLHVPVNKLFDHVPRQNGPVWQ